MPKETPAKVCGNIQGSKAHWDESLAENVKFAVDSSAAAIMVCAFQLLTKHIENEAMSAYIEDALTVLSNEYLKTDAEKTGMLCRSNGRDVYSIYGDYYYMLALAVRVFGIDTCWNAPKEK